VFHISHHIDHIWPVFSHGQNCPFPHSKDFFRLTGSDTVQHIFITFTKYDSYILLNYADMKHNRATFLERWAHTPKKFNTCSFD